MENIYYLVWIKEEYQDKLLGTTVQKKFCGALVNQNDSNFYFELNGGNALVIIPHSWIERMAPSRILWEAERKRMAELKQNETKGFLF